MICFYQIPQDSEGKDWYYYVDRSVTLEQLDELTVEFLAIFNKCPSRLRNRVMQQPGVNAAAIADKERDKDSGSHDAHGASAHRSRADPSSAGIGKLGETLTLTYFSFDIEFDYTKMLTIKNCGRIHLVGIDDLIYVLFGIISFKIF